MKHHMQHIIMQNILPLMDIIVQFSAKFLN